MARGPSSDERSVLPSRETGWRGERVFLRELADYLHHDYVALWKFARHRGLLRHAYRLRGRRAYWVSVATAARLILFARALQGTKDLGGIDHHHRMERIRANKRRAKARLKAEQLKLNNQHLCIANSGAGTEDESRGGPGREQDES